MFYTIISKEPTTHIVVVVVSVNNFSKSQLGFGKWTFLKMSKIEKLKYFSKKYVQK
jgi:hypothetical protein